MTERQVGPFDENTEATQKTLQALVPKLRVETNDLGGDSGIVYDVFDGPEKMFYVVPDDAPGWHDALGTEHEYARTMFAVFAVSPRVRVKNRRWRVGKPFDDLGGLDKCECWGDHEVTACFKTGMHLRVIFEERCDEAERAGPRAMLGKHIGRLMWKRQIEPPDMIADPASDPMATP